MLVTGRGTTYPLPKDGKYGCATLPGVQHDATDWKSKAPPRKVLWSMVGHKDEKNKKQCVESLSPGFSLGNTDSSSSPGHIPAPNLQ